MTILSQVKTGGQSTGQRIVIAGVEKVGKTTMAMGAPKALLVPLETDNVALTRYSHVPPAALPDWNAVKALCGELRAEAMAGRIGRGSSLVWDSGTALERFIHEFVVNTSPEAVGFRKAGGRGVPPGLSMETAHGGYGKAYALANAEFGYWSRAMDELSAYGGINVVVTCHVFPSRVVDPAHGEFDTWDLQLHSPKNNKTYGKREYITQWADMIGFLHEPMFVMAQEKGQSVVRGVSANQGRHLAVDRTPAWVAGNRYGLTGTIPIPEQGGWNALARAIYDRTGGKIDLFNRDN